MSNTPPSHAPAVLYGKTFNHSYSVVIRRGTHQSEIEPLDAANIHADFAVDFLCAVDKLNPEIRIKLR